MRRGVTIGILAGAIAALSIISLIVLADIPADTDDSTEKMMTYMSLVLFVMALALVGPLALAIARKNTETDVAEELPETSQDDFDDEASEIELEFRALEMEIERDEKG
ncbi:MAG: hypothetical protein JSU93_01550 [Methanobacteriota archaeon]|nr:MAG: hypothetical protein JSU93_01550 [Euryarchaeota archaeon]